jgi:hypothetical protein
MAVTDRARGRGAAPRVAADAATWVMFVTHGELADQA